MQSTHEPVSALRETMHFCWAPCKSHLVKSHVKSGIFAHCDKQVAQKLRKETFISVRRNSYDHPKNGHTHNMKCQKSVMMDCPSAYWYENKPSAQNLWTCSLKVFQTCGASTVRSHKRQTGERVKDSSVFLGTSFTTCLLHSFSSASTNMYGLVIVLSH